MFIEGGKNKIYLLPNLVLIIRLTCFVCFLLFAIDVNIYSATFLLLTIASLYLVKKKPTAAVSNFSNFKVKHVDLNKSGNNPYKVKLKKSSHEDNELSEVPENIIKNAQGQLFDYYFSEYSASDSDSLRLFEEIKNKSDCLFAKRSKLWGAHKWNKNLTVEENIRFNVMPSFLLFSNFHAHLNLDGYLVHLSGDLFGSHVDVFAQVFCQLVESLAKNDPSGRNCLSASIDVDSPKWVFEFNRVTFFITTFAPIYPATHSRYTHEVNECFVLFQPEISFARHNLPPDTPATNWDQPQTVRDRIRVQFRTSGRDYLIRDTVNYPMSHDIVKPLHNNDPPVEWWKYRVNTQ